MHYLTGTIRATCIIQRAQYRQQALVNRHCTGNMHYSTGTVPATGTIQPALYRQHALFNRHCTGKKHFSTGTVPATCIIQTVLYQQQALFNRHYGGERPHYLSCCIFYDMSLFWLCFVQVKAPPLKTIGMGNIAHAVSQNPAGAGGGGVLICCLP